MDASAATIKIVIARLDRAMTTLLACAVCTKPVIAKQCQQWLLRSDSGPSWKIGGPLCRDGRADAGTLMGLRSGAAR
jgi:hypothetical protein